MNSKPKKKKLSEAAIDEIVIAHADDDSAWEKPIYVKRKKAVTIPLPLKLATQVAFFARLHRETSSEAWLQRIIQERLHFEEAAFTQLKRSLASHQK